MLMAFMLVQKNTSSGRGSGFVLRFNAVNGVYEDMLKEIGSSRDVSLAYDGMYPAINSSPHSIGCVYSINYFTVDKDSIKYFASNNGGISFTTQKTLAGTSNHFVKTAIAYGRSLTKNAGRYFAAWEEKPAPSSEVGHIYTSHSVIDVNGGFSTPLLVDSLIPGALNNVRNPAIACQFVLAP